MNTLRMKRTVALLLAFLLTVSGIFTGTSVEVQAAKAKAPTKITLNSTNKVVVKGKTFKLKVASVKPAKASKSVTFKSTKPKIASVNKNGTIKGLKKGKATIQVISKIKKNVKATCKVQVAEKAVKSIKVSAAANGKIAVAAGKTITVKPSVLPKGSVAEGYTYTIKDKSVATVNNKGKITGKAGGTTTLTIKQPGSKKSLKLTVLVAGAEVPSTQIPTPSSETPATQTPTPSSETPATQTPTPSSETPSTEAPSSETPGTEAPSSETPGTEAPPSETPDTETPSSETPSTEAPSSETPNTEKPSSETPSTQEPDTEVPPESEIPAIYRQNFESVTDALTVASSGYMAEGLTIENHASQGKYLSFKNTSGSGNRSADIPFTDLDVADKQAYMIEFDAAITPKNNTATIALKDTNFSSTPDPSGPAANSGYVFKLQTSDSKTYVPSEVANKAVTLSSGAWYHYSIYVDKDKKMVSTTILDASKKEIAKQVMTPFAGAGNVTGMYVISGRGNGICALDNIVIRDVTDRDEFGELGEEMISSIELGSKLEQKIANPPEDSPVHLPVEIKVTGDQGGDLSDQVSVEWSTVGLDTDDGYVSLTKEAGTGAGTDGEKPDGTNAYFNVRNGVGNYFGYVQAKVTYEDKEKVLRTPFVILGKGTASATQLAPDDGYFEDMNDYADSLVGYQGTADAINGRDMVLNNWSIYGSNSDRTMKLVKDEAGVKSLEFASNGGGGSTVAVYQWIDQTSQYVIDFTAKFPANIAFGVYANTPNNADKAKPEWTASYASGTLTVGTQAIANISATEWYRYVISADPSVQKYTVAVYDEDGRKVGETAEVEMTNPADNQKYFCFSGSWPMYLQKFKAYRPTLQEMIITSSADTIKVPDEGETDVTVELSSILTGEDGIKITGAPTWSLAEEYANVELTSSGQAATLTVKAGASGAVTVVATKDGIQAEKVIRLTTSGNVVAFTKSISSVTIPFAGEEPVVYQFAAETRSGSGEPIEEGGAITYTLLDKNFQETVIKGVTFENAILTVAADATPGIVIIKAQNEEGLSATIRVNIHGMSFAFGSKDPEEGYTQVTNTSQYSDKIGYGFHITEGLTAAEDSISGTTAYRFKAKVPNGNYNVSVDTTSDSLKAEVVERVSVDTGITKTGANFSVAVCDGVLDLTFAANSSVKQVVISQAPAKTKQAKPNLYAIGDSTTNNNAEGNISWGNVVGSAAVTLPDCFGSFTNRGKAGDNSVVYYNAGRAEEVLLALCPGDYVTVNMGINGSESSDTFLTLMGEYYVEGIIQRGAIPIIVTATPDGPVTKQGTLDTNLYNPETKKFTNNRGDGARNGLLRQIAQEKGLDKIELGQWGEDWMNTLTAADVAAYNAEYGTTHKEVIDMVLSWYGDHNHYKEYLANRIANYLLGEVAKIVQEDAAATE